jgi:hypothetical protein
MGSTMFSREFLALVVRFAEHVARIRRLPLDEALLHFTPLYLSFGLPRDFDRRHPVWQAFVAGLAADSALVDRTHAFYLDRRSKVPVTDPDPAFGCFYYAVWPENRVRIHFQNAEPSGSGPLGPARRPRRLAELTAMFGHLRRMLPSGATVVGGSWLYNIDAYRRLFPPPFLATSRVGDGEYQFMAQWGQLLDRHGHVRPAAARTFLDRLARRTGDDDLAECFPYRVLRLESAIEPFYEFYDVSAR